MTQERQESISQEQEMSFSRMQPGQQPAKKKNSVGKVLGLIFLVLVLLAGGGAAYRYLSGDINGSYRSQSLEKEILSDAEIEDSDFKDAYKDIMKDARVELEVKGDQVVAKVSYKVDTDAVYRLYQQSVDKELEGSDPEIAQRVKAMLPSKEDIISQFNQSVENESKDLGLTYKEETGKVSGEMFKGKVNRWTRRIEITSINKKLFSSSNGKSSLKDFTTGKDMRYSKKSTGVVLGDSGDSVTFAKN